MLGICGTGCTEEKKKQMRRLAVVTAIAVMCMTSYAETKTIVNGEYIVIDKDYAKDTVEIFHHQQDAVEIFDAPPINRISDALDDVDANGHSLEYMGEFKMTYYCPCRKCNGKWGAIDSKGNPLVFGTIAVDPRVIPLGTQVVIDGYDTVFTARDTGSGVHGNHIDMFVPVSHSEALAMPQGQHLKVWKYK